MKKIIQGPFLGLLVMVVSTQPVRAYLTAQETAQNSVQAVEALIHITEDFDPPEDPEPGTSFVKRPVIVNDSLVPAYVRAKIIFSSLAARQILMEPVIGSGWSFDGTWYWYDQALSPAQAAEPLFSRLFFREDVSKEQIEECLPFEILVYAEGTLAGESAQESFERVEGGNGI